MWDNDSVVLYFYMGMAILALWAVSQAWRSQANTETIHPFKAFVHLLAFYLSYLLPPLVFLVSMRVFRAITPSTKRFLYF